MTNEVRTELIWSEEAWETWIACRNHCARIGAYYEDIHAQRALMSLGHCLMSVLAAGPTYVFRDGPDSLLFQTPHITIGMIFHRDTPDKIARDTELPLDEVEAFLKIDWPYTGEWEMHS